LALEYVLLGIQQGEFNIALENTLWKKVENEDPAAGLILETLVQANLYAYRLGNALNACDRLLQIQPNHVPALVWRGYVWEGLQQTDKAREDYQRTVDLDPTQVDARKRLAETLLVTGDAPSALVHFEFLHRRQPNDSSFLLGMARCQRRLSQFDDARQL